MIIITCISKKENKYVWVGFIHFIWDYPWYTYPNFLVIGDCGGRVGPLPVGVGRGRPKNLYDDVEKTGGDVQLFPWLTMIMMMMMRLAMVWRCPEEKLFLKLWSQFVKTVLASDQNGWATDGTKFTPPFFVTKSTFCLFFFRGSFIRSISLWIIPIRSEPQVQVLSASARKSSPCSCSGLSHPSCTPATSLVSIALSPARRY